MRTIRLFAAPLAVLSIVVSGGIAFHAVTSVHAVARSSLPEHIATVSPLANFLSLTQRNIANALDATSGMAASAQQNVSNILSLIPSDTAQLASASAANLSPLQAIAHNIYLSVCQFIGSCPTFTEPTDQQQPEPQFRVVTSLPIAPAATTTAIVTSAATPRTQVASQPTIINNITQPIKERVIERIVERAPAAPAASQSWFADQLNQLENKLTAKISSVSVGNATGPAAYVQSVPFAQSQKIDQLTNTTITNPTITGGSISGTSVTANSFSLSGAFDAAVATIGDLTGARVTSTNGDNGITPLGASSTPWSVDYGRITPLIVKAVQDVAGISSTFKSNLVAWLASAENGIGDFFARVGHFNEADVGKLCTKKSDGTEVCASGDQLAAILAGTNAGAPEVGAAGAPENPPMGSTGAATSTTSVVNNPPTLVVNGNDPATVSVDDTYVDLGATITGPQADLNLGLTTLLDGATTTELTLDTSVPGTHKIEYTVTDPEGLTGSATRTVIVSAANDNQASSTPVNDNSATTSAASTTAQ